MFRKNVKKVGRRWVVTSALRSSSRSASQWWRAALLVASRRAEICDMLTTACTPASLAACTKFAVASTKPGATG